MPRERRREEVRERPGDHRAKAEPRQIVLALGRERADAADLNPDRAEVREAAQRERGDGERDAGRALPFIGPRCAYAMNSLSTMRSPSSASDRAAVVPGHTHDPRDRPEDPAEHRLQRRREPRHSHCDPAKQSVDQRDERDERNQHRDHVEHELQAFARAARRRIEHVHVGARDVDLHAAQRLGDFRSRARGSSPS